MKVVQFQAIPREDCLIIQALDDDGQLWEGTIGNDAWDRAQWENIVWLPIPGPAVENLPDRQKT